MPKERALSSTLFLGAGVLVLIVAVMAGIHAGDQTMRHAVAGASPHVAPLIIKPATHQRPGSYGPSWQESQVMAAPTDPGFPDPRVPPRPLPTAHPRHKAASPTPTYNPNIPVWRQQPIPPLPIKATPTPAQARPSASPSQRPRG